MSNEPPINNVTSMSDFVNGSMPIPDYPTLVAIVDHLGDLVGQLARRIDEVANQKANLQQTRLIHEAVSLFSNRIISLEEARMFLGMPPKYRTFDTQESIDPELTPKTVLGPELMEELEQQHAEAAPIEQQHAEAAPIE